MWHWQLKYYVSVVALRHEVTQLLLPEFICSACLLILKGSQSDDDNMNIDMPSWHSMKNLIWNAFFAERKECSGISFVVTTTKAHSTQKAFQNSDHFLFRDNTKLYHHHQKCVLDERAKSSARFFVSIKSVLCFAIVFHCKKLIESHTGQKT